MSLGSSLSEEVDSMRDKLNYLKMEEVVQHLGETMEDEVNQLLGDIAFLQGCLDDEATYRSESRMESSCEPTLTDLREERSKLEKDLTTVDPVASSPSVKSIRRSSGGLVPNSASKMRPISQQALKPVHNSPTRSAPMKASHSITTPVGDEARETNSAKLSKLRGRSGQKMQSPGGANYSPTRAEIEAMTPTHITIKTAKTPVPRSANLIKVGSIPASGLQQNGNSDGMVNAHKPSPPSAGKSRTRPSSANRFRNMVLNCRETS